MGERLVDRLRGLRPIADITGYSDYELINPDGPEAANVITALEGALTPSGDTKAAYMGEFAFNLTRVDEAGDEYPEKVYVPWTTIKEIMAAIRDRAALSLLRGDGK